MKEGILLVRSLQHNPTLAAVGALVVSLVVAYGVDAIFGQLRDQAQSTFRVIPAALFSAAMPLILSATMLALAWVVLLKLPASRTTAIIFLVAGSLVLGTYLTQFIGFPPDLRNTIIWKFRTAIMVLGTRSALYHLASFWIILGIASLMRQPTRKKTTPDEK
jgi:hypothetical protein